MLKEICITPNVFDYNHIDSVNWKDINSLLEVISYSGFILGLNNKDWKRAAYERINHLEPKVKDRLSTTLSILNDRDRIVGHPKNNNFSGDNEDDWLSVALELNSIRNFHKIIATQAFNGNAFTVKKLGDTNIYQEFGLTGSKQILKTAENLRHLLLPFLAYSKKVTIIDPYFQLDKTKYKDTLKIVADCFRERRGKREQGRILIHCKSNINGKSDDLFKDDLVKWQKIIDKISKTYNHSIEIFGWEGIEDSIKLHDRYFITNQSGLVTAAGTDVDNRQQSEWSIKEYEELNNILSQYNKNSSPFTLKCSVSTFSIEFY
jgi:hypothetical protein